jgi:hypothetical protein
MGGGGSKLNLNRCGLSVFANIGQCFLDDPVEGFDDLLR